MTQCDFEVRLPRYLAEELDAAEKLVVEKHIDDCDRCQNCLGELTSSREAVRWRHLHAMRGDRGRKPAYLGQLKTLHDAADSRLRSPKAAVAAPTIPGYQIETELGRGGMGVVYRATECSLQRTVALKMILAGAHASRRELDQFRAEAAVVATLEHPHIIRIHAISEHEGLPFLCLEYMSGGNLSQKLAKQPQLARSSAELVETLARAVDFAHQRGVIHRDLKPANILLTNDGVSKISDFGLAKRLSDGPSASNASGMVGTIFYMAPEQVSGAHATGPAVDVHALGAILYEMLCGHPPFQGETPYDTLLQISHQEPVPLRQLRPTVDCDLETICLKCLEKSPTNRYASALALADDLHRYVAGEPILARPASPWSRSVKWARRRPGIASLLSAIALISIVSFGLVTWLWNRAESNAVREHSARVENERLSASLWIDQGEALCLKGDVGQGLLAYTRALELSDRCGAAELEHVARVNLAAWPSQLVRQRHSFPHQSQVRVVGYSSDGTRVLTGAADGLVKVWDPATGAQTTTPFSHDAAVLSAVFSPDGKSILVGCGAADNAGSEAYLWDLAAHTARRFPHPSQVHTVAFDPSGESFLTVCPTEAQVWETATGKRRGMALRHEKNAIAVGQFSPDGKSVLTGGTDHAARLWDANTGELRVPALPHAGEGTIRAIAFAPDGHEVVTGGADGFARRWDVVTGKQIGDGLPNHGPIACCAFSTNGKALVVGCQLSELGTPNRRAVEIGGEVKLWRMSETGDAMYLFTMHHTLAVLTLAFSHDSQLLLTGCMDNRVRLYDANNGSLIGKSLLQEDRVIAVAFEPRTSRTALTGCIGDRPGVARLWEIPLPREFGAALDIDHRIPFLRFDPKQPRLFLASDQKPGLLTLDIPSRKMEVPKFTNESALIGLDLSANAEWLLASAGELPAARVFNVSQEKVDRTYEHSAPVIAGAFSPSADFLWTATRDHRFLRWNRTTGQKEGPETTYSGHLIMVRAWSETELAWLEGDDDETRLCVWKTGQGRALLWRQPIHAVAGTISADGSRVVTGDWDSAAYLRDGKTGEAIGPALPNGELRLLDVFLSDNGRIVVTAGWDKNVRIWDVPTGRLLGPPLSQYETVFSITMNSDSTLGASGGEAFGSHLWKLPSEALGSVDDVRMRIESLTGLKRDSRGAIKAWSPPR
jgi:eukaryotic-like serine/threonine-protein kinase